MNDLFTEISPESINENVFQLIGKDWMLITGGDINRFNMMTASWGGLGVLWSKRVAFCFVRPTRYTYGFMNDHKRFTLSFFQPAYRDALKFCGSHSGKESDKIKETGLNPMPVDSGAVSFIEANLIMDCKKIYSQDIDPKLFLDDSIENNYSQNDYHRMYIGEITKCFVKK